MFSDTQVNLINDWRFNIKDHDMHLKSRNNGVLVCDENAVNLDYFGVLRDY